MAAGLGNPPSTFKSFNIKMTVLNDFPDNDDRVITEGILKKGEVIQIKVVDG
jgi:hypothetical protein